MNTLIEFGYPSAELKHPDTLTSLSSPNLPLLNLPLLVCQAQQLWSLNSFQEFDVWGELNSLGGKGVGMYRTRGLSCKPLTMVLTQWVSPCSTEKSLESLKHHLCAWLTLLKNGAIKKPKGLKMKLQCSWHKQMPWISIEAMGNWVYSPVQCGGGGFLWRLS